MGERVAVKVEITCLLNRAIRPIRFWWNGERLSIVAWRARRATSKTWDGDVTVASDREFRLQFVQTQGKWYAEELTESDAN